MGGIPIDGIRPIDPDIESYRWNQSHVTVNIVAGDGQSPVTENERRSLGAALSLWQKTLEHRQVEFDVMGDSATAMVTVTMVDSNYVFPEGPNVLGTTAISGLYDFITHAEIKIRRGGSDRAMRQTLIHELGHGFGILGHSLDKLDIMYPTRWSRPGADSVLTPRDSATMMAVYSSPCFEPPYNPIITTENNSECGVEINVSDPNGLSDIDSVFISTLTLGGNWRKPMTSVGPGLYSATLDIHLDTILSAIVSPRWLAVRDKQGLTALTDFPNFVIVPATKAPLASPTLLSPPDGARDVGLVTMVQWLSVDSAITYDLQVCVRPTFVNPLLDNKSFHDTLSWFGTLTPLTTYYWRVRAANLQGTSHWSQVWSFTTVSLLPEEVTLSQPQNGAVCSPETVLFSWRQPASEVTKFWLELSPDSSFISPQTMRDTSVSDTSRVWKNLLNGITYYWRVRAINSAGWGSFGDVWRFSTSLADVQEQESIPTIFALEQNYPNPFNPTATIQYALPHRSHVTLSVYNTLGQHVATLVNGDVEAGYHTVQFDGSGLASGVYFYRMQTGSFMETKKLLIIR